MSTIRLRAGLLALLKITAVCLAAHLVAASSGGGGGSGGAPGVMGNAAAAAGGGLSACGSLTGTALYNCAANVLDKLSADIQPANAPRTQTELRRAASGLRAAVNKAQALLAITQCQTVISAALSQISARNGRRSGGWGNSELSAVAGVLARVARLIQTKG